MPALLKYISAPLVAVIVGSILTLSGCAHSPKAHMKGDIVPQVSSASINPTQTPPALSDTILRQNNIARNKDFLAEIKKQNYTRYNHDFYFKVLKQGKRLPASSMADKTVTLTLNETLTDGTVTADYNKTQPLVVPYHQLPPPLNLFITETGEQGKLKIYAMPEVAYGRAGIPGKIPPESISITTIEVLSIR